MIVLLINKFIECNLFLHISCKLFKCCTLPYSMSCSPPDLKTALVERSDFSSGTSSRSTKLIHGGVRYLQKAIMQLDYEQVLLVISFDLILLLIFINL